MSKLKYKVGDKVRVLTRLEGGKKYDGLYFSPLMEEFRGKELTVKSASFNYYDVEETGFVFNDAMLADVSTYNFKVGDKVRLKKDLVIGKEYGGLLLLSDMVREAEGISIITRITEEGFVDLYGNYYSYHVEMLELAEETPWEIPTSVCEELHTQDFVRVTIFNHWWCPTKGVEAILIDELPDGRLVIDLGFVAPFTNTCDGRCKSGTAYYEHKNNVRLLG